MTPLRRRRGRIVYFGVSDGEPRSEWGFEDWSITVGDDGVRALQAHCKLELLTYSRATGETSGSL